MSRRSCAAIIAGRRLRTWAGSGGVRRRIRAARKRLGSSAGAKPTLRLSNAVGVQEVAAAQEAFDELRLTI